MRSFCRTLTGAEQATDGGDGDHDDDDDDDDDGTPRCKPLFNGDPLST